MTNQQAEDWMPHPTAERNRLRAEKEARRLRKEQQRRKDIAKVDRLIDDTKQKLYDSENIK